MTTVRRVFLFWCFAGWLIFLLLPVAHAQEFDPEKVLKEHPEICLAIEQKIIDHQTLKTVLTLFQQGRYGEAIPLVEEGLKKGEKVLGSDHAFTATVKHTLATLYMKIGNYAQAEPLQRQALDIREKILGSEHPHTVSSLNNLADLHRAKGANDQALPMYLEVLKICEKVLGPEHPTTALALTNLALLYKQKGAYDQALPLQKRIIRIFERVLGPEHPGTVASLINMAEIYRAMDTYDKALPLLQRALVIQEKVLGPDHPDTTLNLINIAAIHQAMGAPDKALPLRHRVLKIHEKVLGPEHPGTAISLNNLGELYRVMGVYDQALPLFQRALKITEKATGPEHPDTVIILNNLATTYINLGNLSKAMVLQEKLLTITTKLFPPGHPEIINLQNAMNMTKNLSLIESLNKESLDLYDKGRYFEAIPLAEQSLEISKSIDPKHSLVALNMARCALLYHMTGDYRKGEIFVTNSLEICEQNYGPEHPFFAGTLIMLAKTYQMYGDYQKAETIYEKALKIIENSLRPDHKHIGMTLIFLGSNYCELGDYGKAELYYKKALTIIEKSSNPDSMEFVPILSHLGSFYRIIGDYKKSELFFKKALTISEKNLPEDHPSIADMLNHVGLVNLNLGKSEAAEVLFKRAILIKENALGADHPDLATFINNLATLYLNNNKHNKAEHLLKRALAIRQKSLGDDHLFVAASLQSLGWFYASMGEYGTAEPLYRKALLIKEKKLGPSHMELSGCLKDLGLLLAAKGNYEEAFGLYKRALTIDRKIINNLMGFTSDRQKSIFLSQIVTPFDYGLLRYVSVRPSARIEALNILLNRKSLILEAQRSFQEAIFFSEDPKAAQAYEDLTVLRRQLSRITFADPGKDGLKDYKKKISELEVQKENLEAEISRFNQRFDQKRTIVRADCNQVAAKLPPGAALLEYAKLIIMHPNSEEKGRFQRKLHYIAFILRGGKNINVDLIDLGDAEAVDNAIAQLKKEVTKKGLDHSASKFTDDGVIVLSKKTCGLIFEPIRDKLKGIKEIFISPDANLNLLPFEILVGPDGKYLIEDYTFNYLPTGRDILRFGKVKAHVNKSILIGDPDFDLGAKEKVLVLSKLGYKKSAELNVALRSRGMVNLPYERIPATGEEVRAIKAIIGDGEAELYTGKEAVEEVLKIMKTPKILHLATHGFFLGDQEIDSLASRFQMRGIVQMVFPFVNESPTILIENPLLRSGFVLAGANVSLKKDSKDNSDGVVTAEKVMGLNLWGTDMVVLSSCQSGLGEVKAGVGIFGLRQAFTQAGAKSLVMSMWKVPDKETQELMMAFYKNLKAGTDRCQALRQAALYQKKVVKERYGHAHPFFWGGFIFSGEP